MTAKSIFPCALWQRVNDIESDIISGHANELREMHPDDTELHDLWFEITRMRFMSLDAFISEDKVRRDWDSPCWDGLLLKIDGALGEFDAIKRDPDEADPTSAYYEVEVEYYLKTKVVVEIDTDTVRNEDFHQIAAVDAYGEKIEEAMEAAERVLNEVCEEVEIESRDVQLEKLKNCPACKGSGSDDICMRFPCPRCDGEGWEAK